MFLRQLTSSSLASIHQAFRNSNTPTPSGGWTAKSQSLATYRGSRQLFCGCKYCSLTRVGNTHISSPSPKQERIDFQLPRESIRVVNPKISRSTSDVSVQSMHHALA